MANELEGHFMLSLIAAINRSHITVMVEIFLHHV